jgi:hypothetical protein
VFFDALGRILARAGEVLRTDIRAEIEDDYVRQQVDAIAVIVCETAAAWSELFAALEHHNTHLAAALREAGHAAPALSEGANGDDPLRRNAELLTAIDQAMCLLHDRRGDDASAALRAIRRRLTAAAEVERTLLTRARERSGMATTRRL